MQVWIAGYEPGTHIDFDVDAMAYSDFVDKEYIIMAVQSNLRGIPHVIDGFKPSQRKILFACLKRKLHSEIKVAQVRVLKVLSQRCWLKQVFFMVLFALFTACILLVLYCLYYTACIILLVLYCLHVVCMLLVLTESFLSMYL